MSPVLRSTIAVVVVAALAVGVTAYVTNRSTPTPGSSTNDVNVATVQVRRMNLSATEEVSGTLGYVTAPSLIDRVAGTYTSMPPEGAIVAPGESLFAVDGQPVTLLAGSLPAWRSFTPGMTDGFDVGELQRALQRDGARDANTVPVDGHYGARTIVAVRAWRARHGLPAANDLPFGSIVFMPEPVRVGRHTSEIGDPAQPGTAPYATTGTTRVVAVELDVARLGTTRAGQAVQIGLASGRTISGRVTAVGRVAHVPAGSAPDNGARPAVTVSVEPLGASPVDEPDEEPVTVGLVSATRAGVLAVPVTALLALAEGGYGVEVVTGQGRHTIIAVEPGLFADTMVEIRGQGITDATTVVTAR